MKKMLLSFVLLATMLVSTNSQAIVGAANNSRALAITGLAMMDLSQVVVVSRSNFGYAVVRVITWPALFVAGLVLLDENGRYDISGEITAETAEKAGLTNAEKYAIEDNSEEINVLFDEISLEVENMEGTQKEKIEHARNLWRDYSANLDEEVLSGLVKVMNIE